MGKSALLSNGKGNNAYKVQDSETTLLVSNKADKIAKENHLDDSDTTPKFFLYVVFELLAQALRTRCLNQFVFLSLNFKLKDIDQMLCDRKPKD